MANFSAPPTFPGEEGSAPPMRAAPQRHASNTMYDDYSSTTDSQAFGVGNPEMMFDQMGKSPMTQMGLSYGKNMAKSVWAKYMPGLSLLYATLKTYFNVDHTYVKNKLKVLLLPFRHKSWRRIKDQHEGTHEIRFAQPIEDVNAPDLYIPLMSFLTFVLVVGFMKGTHMRFTPETLGDVSSTSLVTQLVEVVIIRVGLHVFGTPGGAPLPLTLLDIWSFAGYKYLGLVINMIAGVVLGWYAYFPCLLYTGTAAAVYMVNTMKANVSEPAPGTPGRTRQNYFLLSLGLLQFLVIWWHGYTGEFAAPVTAATAVAASSA